jgi:DNA-binding NtrC family response regulator
MTRLLLVDGSDLMEWIVAHLIPRNVEVVRVGSFAEADRLLRNQPPDAAIFNIAPRHLDWRALLERCLHHEPAIPFLCCSAIEPDEERDGRLPCRPEDHFTKSIPQDEFRELLTRLCAESRARGNLSRGAARSGVPEDRNLGPKSI